MYDRKIEEPKNGRMKWQMSEWNKEELNGWFIIYIFSISHFILPFLNFSILPFFLLCSSRGLYPERSQGVRIHISISRLGFTRRTVDEQWCLHFKWRRVFDWCLQMVNSLYKVLFKNKYHSYTSALWKSSKRNKVKLMYQSIINTFEDSPPSIWIDNTYTPGEIERGSVICKPFFPSICAS